MHRRSTGLSRAWSRTVPMAVSATLGPAIGRIVVAAPLPRGRVPFTGVTDDAGTKAASAGFAAGATPTHQRPRSEP